MIRPINMPLTEKCYECGKPICEDEWVVNWGSCDDCFNKHLDAYIQEHPEAALPDPETGII